MNPEFMRQVWLHISLQRVIVMLAVLALSVLSIVISSKPEAVSMNLSIGAATGFLFLAFGMGGYAVRASIVDELIDRTWDQQRMSALLPWAMTWGKLLGATLYSWIGASICIVIWMLCAWGRAELFWDVFALCMILAACFFQALTLAVHLQLSQLGLKFARQGILLFPALLVLAASLLPSWKESDQITWWGQNLSMPLCLLGMLVLAAICAFVAAWRTMAQCLSVQQLSWGWPVLGFVVSTYLAGFYSENAWDFAYLVNRISGIGIFVCGVMTYFALISESHSRLVWQRIRQGFAAQDWHAAFSLLPRWVSSFLLTLLFAGLYFFVASDLALSSKKLISISSPVIWALLIARDTALALFFALAPQARRPIAAFLVTMLILHLLMSWLHNVVDEPYLRAFLYPASQALELQGIAMSFIQAALAWGVLLIWRLPPFKFALKMSGSDSSSATS